LRQIIRDNAANSALQFGVQNFLGVGIAKDQLIPIVKKSIEDICAHSPLGMYTSPLREPLVNVSTL
jgi:hypothetical protein